MTAAASNAAPPVKLKMNMLDLILSRPPAPFRDEKEEEGLTAFDLIYRYQANVRKWCRTSGHTLDENQFIMHFRKLTTFKDHEILDIFDTFDREDSGRIGCDEFFLLLSLLAARESGRTTQFLHMHSKQLFDTIGKNSPQLSFERFARLGFVIGVPEHAILHRLKEFGVGVFDAMTFDDFNTCYFAIFDDLDKGTFDAKSTVLTSISTGDLDSVKRDEKCIVS